MARGAHKAIEDFVKNLKIGTNVTVSKKNMRLIGERCIQLIVTRTQRGLGVRDTGGAELPFRVLSDRYIDYRRSKSKLLDSTTRPEKSNLTFTGAMLRSMTLKTVNDGSISIGPSQQRRKGGITNEQIAVHLEKNRPFNNLSKREISTVVEFIDSILQLEIVKI